MHCLHRQGHAKKLRRCHYRFDLDRSKPAVGFDDQLTERQTDAAAADFACLAELEDLLTPFRRHAWTSIADIDDYFIGGFN